MRILVTGSSGFAGRHVIDELRSAGHDPVRLDSRKSEHGGSEPEYIGDLRDASFITETVERENPDCCIHLGGIAFVPTGWSDPALVMSVNLNGTLNVLEAFRKTRPESRILTVTSSEVYGRESQGKPLEEDDAMRPSNLYAVSKMAADLATLLYAGQYGMHVMTARPQNHIGQGQSSRFVATAFAEQLAEIAHGLREPVVRVGNLDSKRDFLDVRDVARAYRMIIELGSSGHAYNIASGKLVRISDILEILSEHAGLQPRIETDQDLYRPADRPPLLSIEKIRRDTGWEPRIPIKETLKNIYDAALSGKAST